MWIFSFAILSGSSLGVAKAWSNPSQTAPSGQPGPIVIALGGTQASTVPQALSDLGTAASGANSDITSLSPSGNLVLTPTGYVGIGTASPGLELGINGGVLANEGLPSCTPTNAGYSFNGDGCYDTGMFSSGDGDLRLYNNQVLTLHATQSGVVIPTGLAIGTTTIPASGIEFPDGTVQTTAYVYPTNGNQTWTTPGTYTWTVPSGVTRILVEEWGAGGGGGAGGYSGGAVPGGTGGGGGAYTYGWMDVTPKSNVTVVVGSGGTGGLPWAGSGTGGGSSSVGSTIVANGGGAGENENLGAPGGGSAQTTGYYSNYAILVAFAGGGYNNSTKSNGGGAGAGSAGGGGNGGSGSYYFVSVGAGAPGYGALAGGASGGDGTSVENANGSNGAAPGGGGGGGGTVTSGTQPITGGVGGNGGNGEVIIRW